MSYGIGLIIRKEDLNKSKIPFDFIDWMMPIAIKIHPAILKEDVPRWYKEFEKETKFTTLSKLKTAPCDHVSIIGEDNSFSTMQNRNPINGKGIDIKNYLTFN